MKSWVLGLGSLLLLAACATSTPKAPPFVAAHSQQAQVQWKKGASSLICEAVFARANDGSVQAQLYKGTAKVLLTLTLEDNTHLQAKGPLAGLGWTGYAAIAPPPLMTWAALMQTYQAVGSWPDGEREAHFTEARASVVIDHGKLQSLKIINDLNGEMITANFSKTP